MPRFNSIPTKIPKLVLTSVLLLILCSSSDQSEIRPNRNQKIERQRQPRQAPGPESSLSCKPPMVLTYNGDECILPLNAPCKSRKECPLNADCTNSKCACVDKATPHEDNLSCEFFYTDDLSLDINNLDADNKGQNKNENKNPNTEDKNNPRGPDKGKAIKSGTVPGILRWSSVKMWTIAFGIIVLQYSSLVI